MAALRRPIGILDEHPEWSKRLMTELASRRVPFEKIDHSNHAYDPRDREPRYAVIVNRTSPSSHTRGHGGVLFYAEALLAHYEALGIPVINPVAAYRFERSKALQIELFERLGIRYPRTIVANHRDQILKAIDRLRFPLMVKPNVGGSGAGIVRFDTAAELEGIVDRLDLGVDHTVLLQEYVAPKDDAITRIEVMGGKFLYAIRLVRRAATSFNLCPADVCQVPAAPASAAAASCPVDAAATPGVDVSRTEPPAAAIDAAIRVIAGASIDIGGVEYLESAADGAMYFYDVNATSNFVANAPTVLGFDPIPLFADYIIRIATAGR